MTLVKARAALEVAIRDSLKDDQPKVTVVFDNTPFTTPGRMKKYVLVSIDFDTATYQPQGAAQTYYTGRVVCGIFRLHRYILCISPCFRNIWTVFYQQRK